MNKSRLSEFDIPKFQILDEIVLNEKKPDETVLRVRVKWQHADRINNNNRRYKKELLQREIDRIQSDIKQGAVYSCGYHPDNPTAQENIVDVAGLWRSAEMKPDGNCEGIVDVLPTSQGKNVQALIKAGGKVGLSSRAYGTLTRTTETINGKRVSFDDVNDDFFLKSPGDFVLSPSVPDAKVLSQMSEEIERVEEELKEVYSEYLGSSREALLAEIQEVKLQQTKLEQRINDWDNKDSQSDKPSENDKDQKGEKMTLDEAQKKHVVLYDHFVEAVKSGFKGDFEAFKKMKENSDPNFNKPLYELPPWEKASKKIEEEERQKHAGNKENYRLYNEAVLSGFKGSFDQFMELRKQADAERPLKEAIKQAASQLAEKISPYFNHVEERLSEEVVRKGQLKRYREDVQKGLFEGSFVEWLSLEEKRIAKIEEKEKNKIKAVSS